MTDEEERDEIVRNAEQACKKGEITKEFLLWLRIFTAKHLERNKKKC